MGNLYESKIIENHNIRDLPWIVIDYSIVNS